MGLKFVEKTPLGAGNALTLASGWFWKLKARQWAFFDLDVVDDVELPKNLIAQTNNFDVIGKIELKRGANPKTATIRMCGKNTGSAYVYLRDQNNSDPFKPYKDVQMQVEITQRNAMRPEDHTMVDLTGKTFVINAPDANIYKMETTKIFPSDSNDPRDLLKDVPAGANHVVVACHGDFRTKPLAFVAGKRRESMAVGLDNAAVVFAKLRGHVSNDCVVWMAGCLVGGSLPFGKAIADASGCPVVATSNVLPTTPLDRGKMDMIDRHMAVTSFWPGVDKRVDIGELCVEQQRYNFKVPL